jgi:CRISPR/Cas system-associated exonuclease Cas4 (RecB family)
MSKVKCPDGTIVSSEWCVKGCKEPCMPLPVRKKIVPKKRRERKEHDKPRFGVTRLMTKCLRRSYYDLTEEVVHDLEKLWIFNRGHAIHEFVTTELIDKEKEVFISKDFGGFVLLGYIDALHEGVLYEFKTTANVPNDPQEHHSMQAQAYYSMLSDEEKEKTKKIVIVYFSMQQVKEFEVPKRDISNWLKTYGDILAAGLNEKVPPNPMPGWICNYCDFFEKCNKDNREMFLEKNGNKFTKFDEDMNNPNVIFLGGTNQKQIKLK